MSCTSYGPQTIERDRMGYGMSIRASIKEQLLTNIVGLRYMEAPVFVDVSSIINQYALSGQVDAGVGFNTSFSRQQYRADWRSGPLGGSTNHYVHANQR